MSGLRFVTRECDSSVTFRPAPGTYPLVNSVESNPQDPDAELVARAQAGDMMAQASLYKRYRIRVFRYLNSLGLSDPDAEEVASRTLEIMLRAIRAFRGESWFQSWVFSIARRRGTRFRARRKARPGLVPLDDCLALAGSALLEPAERELRARRMRDYRQALVQLTPGQREVIVLVHEQGLSYEQAARVLGKTRDATAMLLRRALLSLRARLTSRSAPTARPTQPSDETGRCNRWIDSGIRKGGDDQ
jgi:RNA polymerase sigma-70 factor (ECF subfamily)